jgi:hypothetical protein
LSAGLSLSAANEIIDDPTLLSPNSTLTLSLGQQTRAQVLSGYIHGFKVLFIINAAFSAFALVSGIFLIEHLELTRPDEAKLREEARLWYSSNHKANNTESCVRAGPTTTQKVEA